MLLVADTRLGARAFPEADLQQQQGRCSSSRQESCTICKAA